MKSSFQFAVLEEGTETWNMLENPTETNTIKNCIITIEFFEFNFQPLVFVCLKDKRMLFLGCNKQWIWRHHFQYFFLMLRLESSEIETSKTLHFWKTIFYTILQHIWCVTFETKVLKKHLCSLVGKKFEQRITFIRKTLTMQLLITL